jgi:hypothetical protein
MAIDRETRKDVLILVHITHTMGSEEKKGLGMLTSIRSHPPRLTPRTFCLPYGKLGLNARAAGRRQAKMVYAETSISQYRVRNETSHTKLKLGGSCRLITTGILGKRGKNSSTWEGVTAWSM